MSKLLESLRMPEMTLKTVLSNVRVKLISLLVQNFLKFFTKTKKKKKSSKRIKNKKKQ